MSKTSDAIITLANQLAEDDAKFEEKGNSSAGTRARKTLQEIKKLCGERRTEIQDQKNKE